MVAMVRGQDVRVSGEGGGEVVREAGKEAGPGRRNTEQLRRAGLRAGLQVMGLADKRRLVRDRYDDSSSTGSSRLQKKNLK